jgi:hypothetical protein
MEAAGPKQRPRQYSVRKLLKRRGSTKFGSNLNRLSQPHCAPLLGPEHRQVGQALDAEPAKVTDAVFRKAAEYLERCSDIAIW